MEEEIAARAPGQQEIEDETADKEYNIDEECMSGGNIPKGTGVDNSDIESMTTNETDENGNNRDGCGDESMGSTEEELLNIEEKEKDNKEENNEEEYTGTDNEIDDESSDKEEEESEEEDSEEEKNDATASDILCCAGDLCEQQEGSIIIGTSHKCAVCEGRFHGFLCSNGNVQTMTGMMCKKCDNNNNVEKNTDDQSENNMVLVENTEKIGNEVGNGKWNKVRHIKKPMNKIQNTNNNNKKKHHNQDAGRGQTGTGPTGIIRKGSNYQDGGRGRRGREIGEREDMNTQHVRKTVIRFEDTKPVEPKPKKYNRNRNKKI